jgi:hypothetical protein
MKLIYTFATILLSIQSFGQLTDTNLPIIKITTGGQTIPDDPKVTMSMGIINGTGLTNNINDPFTDYDGPIGIETRGNSTQGFDKKTYSLELRSPAGADSSVALLGMPKESDWILHAMVIDKSLLRIPMSFYLSQRMGHYASRWEFVELEIDGNYQGVYILCERLKRDANRVDIAKLKPTDISGDQLTGGYILRLDWLESPQGFESQYNSVGGIPMFYQWYYPKADNIQPAQATYIKDYMDDMEEALWSSDGYNLAGHHYSKYIDLTSFSDFLIMNELSRNSDGYKLSSYVHKEKIGAGNKIKAGPIWDFDQTYGMSTVCGGEETDGWNYTQTHPACEDYETLPLWWEKLMADPVFTDHLKCRWESHRTAFLHKDSINDWIDNQAAYIDEAKDRNFVQWDFLGEEIWSEPAPIPADYPAEISYMKGWISDRIDWLDANIPGVCSNDQSSIEEVENIIEVHPNPSNGIINIALGETSSDMIYNIYDLNGKQVLSAAINSPFFQLDLSGLQKGIYLLEIATASKNYREKIVLN